MPGLHEKGNRPAEPPFASWRDEDYIDVMTTETVPNAEPETPRLARWAAGVGIGALALTAGLLWWTQGTKVFLDTLAAGLAWCF
jgi:hypothetical protein